MIYDWQRAPTPQCHASTIAETASGLIAAWFGGPYESHPDVGIWLSRRSRTGWSPPVEVAHGRACGCPCWNPVLFSPQEGPLMLFYKVGPTPASWWGMLMTSTDEGRTWSAPSKLGQDAKVGHLLGPVKNKPIQRADGAILCPSSTESNHRWRVHFEITHDLGHTWEVVGPIHSGEDFGAIQPSILCYPNGHLQILCRSQQQVIVQSWSQDGGATWSPMTATALPNPNSGIDAVTLQDGRQVLAYNPTSQGRSPLSLAVSTDGQRWVPRRVLEQGAGEFSYPAIIQARGGEVHVTYTYLRRNIQHVVLDAAEI